MENIWPVTLTHLLLSHLWLPIINQHNTKACPCPNKPSWVPVLPGSQKLSELCINPNLSGQSWLRSSVIDRMLAPLSLVSPSTVGLPALVFSTVWPTAIPGRYHWAMSKLRSASWSLSATFLCNHSFLHWAHVSSWKPLKAKLLSHFGVSSCLPTWRAL